MSEEFTGNQVFRQGAAVDPDEGFVGPAAVAVDIAGHQFLAHAGFAGDHHCGIGGGHLFHLGKNPADSRALADDVLEVQRLLMFFLVVLLFFFELFAFVSGLLIGPGVVQGNGRLGGEIGKKLQVRIPEDVREQTVVVVKDPGYLAPDD